MLILPMEVKVYMNLLLLSDIMVGRWAEGRHTWEAPESIFQIQLHMTLFFFHRNLYIFQIRFQH